MVTRICHHRCECTLVTILGRRWSVMRFDNHAATGGRREGTSASHEDEVSSETEMPEQKCRCVSEPFHARRRTPPIRARRPS